MPRVLRSLLQLVIVILVAVFLMGARSGEGAIQPARVPVPAVCPCVAHVRCQTVQTKSADGTTLKGWYYQPDNPNGGAILMLHGVGGNRADVIGLAAVYERAGYTVLTPDLRGHGESGGFVSYGVQDEPDIKAWLDWITTQTEPKIERLYGYGASLGASVLTESLASETRFRAIVAESPYSDFTAIADERIRRQAPAALKWLAGPVVTSGIFWVDLRHGVNLRASSAVDAIRKTHTPILLVHGLEDNLTSPDNSRRLAAANPAAAQLWLMPHAGHANLWATSKTEFESRTLTWFASH